jgi:hypothetical protein
MSGNRIASPGASSIVLFEIAFLLAYRLGMGSLRNLLLQSGFQTRSYSALTFLFLAPVLYMFHIPETKGGHEIGRG